MTDRVPDPVALLRGRAAADASTRLLEAAAARFAEIGYHATTTRDIAERAGMSPAAVYVHYASKLELLKTISRLGHEDAHDCLRTALAAGDTPAEKIGGAIRALAQWHAENQTVARVAQYEYRALPPDEREDVKLLRRRMQAEVEQEIARGVETGVFNTVDTASASLAILSLCVDIARWYGPHETRSPRELGEAYAGLALNMIGATGR